MPTATRYPTKRIDCWGQMKEIRRRHFRHTWEAREKGEVVILGVFEWFLCLFSGLGDFANPSYGPYYTVLMRNPDQLVKTMEFTESLGFTKDVCSSMRCHLGQLYSGLTTKSPLGGTMVPDFIFQPAICHSVVKTGQLASEYLGIPYFDLEFPFKDSPQTRRYLVAQMEEAIEWMGKVTGRRYDDEKFLHALECEWECMVLWARICELNKAVPAPLDMRMMWSLRLPIVTSRHRLMAVDFYRTLHDEVKERVRQGISANGRETARLTYEGGPPFYAVNIFREPEPYGAVFVGGEAAFVTMAAWDMNEADGSWKPALTPAERGIEVRTRQQGMDSLAELYLKYYPMLRWLGLQNKPLEHVRRAQDWGAQGVVFHLDRGCRALSAGMEEAKLAVQRAGFPTVMYESSMCDPRDLDREKVRDLLESFFESLGLSRLSPDEGCGPEVGSDE